jgi:protein-tyrosine phosphatase
MAEPLRLLVVCLGNICRSPMAEGALRTRLRELGLEDRVEVDSVGTGDWHVGHPPDRRAIACAARNNVDIGALRARQLCAADFRRFDHILCADRSTLRNVLAHAPADMRKRCVLLSEFAEQGEMDIPDPYTGGTREFDIAWSLVDGMAQAIATRLAGEMGHGPRRRGPFRH